MERLALLGIGNLRLGPSVLAAVAGFCGERPLEVRLWDADAERLDLMDRLARALSFAADGPQVWRADSVLDQAVAGAQGAVVSMGRRCADLWAPGKTRPEAVMSLIERLPEGIPVLRLVPSLVPGTEEVAVSDQAPLDATTRPAAAFQVLRWIQGDDPLGGLLESSEESVVRRWLSRLA